MKYIVTKLPDGKEQIFVFDTDIIHAQFFENIKALKTINYDSGTWERKHLLSKVVGAGFVHKGICQGKSESLGIASRGQVDIALLGMV